MGSRLSSSTYRKRRPQGLRNDLEILLIEDKRRSNQRLGADARVPDFETGISLVELADRLECGIMGGTVPDDASAQNRWVQALGTNDVDETDVLIGILHADVRPGQRPGSSGLDLVCSIHASIFAALCSVSSFLWSNASVEDDLGSPPVTAWWLDAEQLAPRDPT
jgi:hypothetical protein